MNNNKNTNENADAGANMATVLRIGHRRIRDQRITTHVALVARAFGAGGVVVSGEDDSEMIEGVKKVCGHWGGKFDVRQEKKWVDVLESAKKEGACIVHLTMYGERVQDKIAEIRKRKKIAVVVGSQKVPMEAYHLADYNISVTGQPHSEIAALAIFLDRYFEGKELDGEFDGERRILPSKLGKNVLLCKK